MSFFSKSSRALHNETFKFCITHVSLAADKVSRKLKGVRTQGYWGWESVWEFGKERVKGRITMVVGSEKTGTHFTPLDGISKLAKEKSSRGVH